MWKLYFMRFTYVHTCTYIQPVLAGYTDLRLDDAFVFLISKNSRDKYNFVFTSAELGAESVTKNKTYIKTIKSILPSLSTSTAYVRVEEGSWKISLNRRWRGRSRASTPLKVPFWISATDNTTFRPSVGSTWGAESMGSCSKGVLIDV